MLFNKTKQKFLVIKVSRGKIAECGGVLSDAIRGPWVVGGNRFSNILPEYTHAIIFFIGEKDIKAVYRIDKWYFHDWDSKGHKRYIFAGERDEELEKKLVGKKGNAELFRQGRQFPLIYLKNTIDLIEL